MIYVVTAAQGYELHRGESFVAAKIVADNHKRDTGHNANVESRSQVYTTQTLDEALKASGVDPRRYLVVTNEQAALLEGGPAWPGPRAIGDHDPEPYNGPGDHCLG